MWSCRNSKKSRATIHQVFIISVIVKDIEIGYKRSEAELTSEERHTLSKSRNWLAASQPRLLDEQPARLCAVDEAAAVEDGCPITEIVDVRRSSSESSHWSRCRRQRCRGGHHENHSLTV